MARLLGFLYGSVRGEERQISKEVVRFVRREQLGRVFHFNRVPSDFQVKTGLLPEIPSAKVP